MRNSSLWHLSESDGKHIAHLACGLWEGQVILDSVGVRLVQDHWDSKEAKSFAAFITSGPDAKSVPNLELRELYLRGHDLVATYAQTPPHQIAPQIYWRANSITERQTTRLEMILSMQTDLLDSEPHASVCSFGLGEVRLLHADALDANCFRELHRTPMAPTPSEAVETIDCSRSLEHLFCIRNEQIGISFAQMVHPADFVSATIFSDDTRPWFIDSALFPERLEKGVIRRARICGWFMPAENDLETAVELARRFVDEPLPLTT